MDRARATLYIILSAFSFAIMQLFVKSMSKTYPTFELVFIRNIIILIFIAFFLIRGRISFKVKIGKIPLLIRCISGFAGLGLSFYAMSKINMSDASALQKTSPFFVTLLSVLILKEKISKENVIAIVFAFIGVLLIVKPSFSNINFPALAALLSAVASALAYVMIAYMGKNINSLLIIFYFSLFCCLFCIPFMLSDFVIPEAKDLLQLSLIGIAGGFGQLFLTLAYKLAPASKISIYDFTNIIFSSILGYLVYSEKINLLSFMGIVMILLGALATHFINNADYSYRKL